jgi:hypothetical protein
MGTGGGGLEQGRSGKLRIGIGLKQGGSKVDWRGQAAIIQETGESLCATRTQPSLGSKTPHI